MGRLSLAVVVIGFGAPFLLVTSGCAGELTEAQKEARDGAGGGGGTGVGSGGTGGSGGAGAAADSGGGNAEACVLALTKAKSCGIVGCHGGSTPAAQLTLSDDVIHQPKAWLVDKTNKGMMPGCTAGMFKLIDSAKPENSLLYTKLSARPPCGDRMPSGGTVTDAELSCVLAWIKSVGGAP